MMAVKLHHALNARLLGKRRIDRLRLADQFGLLHVAADADALRGDRLRLFLDRAEAEAEAPRSEPNR